MRGHLYCSEQCARDAGRHAVWRRVRGVLLDVPSRRGSRSPRSSSPPPRPSSSPSGPSASSTAERLVPLARPRREAPTARLDVRRRDRVRTAHRGQRLVRGAPSFSSRARASSEPRPSTNGRFVFEGVRDRGPFRVGAMPLSSPISYAPPAPTAVPVNLAARTAPTPRTAAAAAAGPRPRPRRRGRRRDPAGAAAPRPFARCRRPCRT